MTLRSSRSLVALAALLALAAGPALADYDAGLSYFKQGKYVESAAEWEAVIANAPEYSFAYYMLGNCYLKLKKYRDAEPQFRKAVELDPGKFNYHLNLAQTLMALRKYPETVKVLDEAENLAGKAQEQLLLHRLRGLSLSQTKDYARAVADLKMASPSKNHQVASALARACYQIDDYGCLKSAVGQALALNGADESSQALLVRATLEKARRTSNKAAKKSVYQQAAAAAKTLVNISEDKTKAHELYGAALLGAEQYNSAIGEFSKVLEAKPKNCNAMMNIATAYQQLSNWNEVISWADKAGRCDPKNVNAPGKAAFAYNKLKKWNEAIAAADRALAIKGSDRWATEQKQIAQKGIDADAHNAEVDRLKKEREAELRRQEEEARAEQERIEAYKRATSTGKKKKSNGGTSSPAGGGGL